jgi:hypothetical protein
MKVEEASKGLRLSEAVRPGHKNRANTGLWQQPQQGNRSASQREEMYDH